MNNRSKKHQFEYTANLGAHQNAVAAALTEMRTQEIVRRIWAHDHTVWGDTPDEIINRLGWLRSADEMTPNVPQMAALAAAVQAEGYTHALLLGMGGSSLAPEVFRKTFGVADGYLDLAVLDSTDPGMVLAHAERLDPSRTLFIVATKSGGTVETLSFFKYFYNWTAEALGSEAAGEHFVAITDPGSKLVALAEKYNFRATFQNNPNIGGRYSALSYFGLLPAALLGLDVLTLLERAQAMMSTCAAEKDNPGAWLGAVMGALAQVGRDKITLAASPQLASFGDWVEQLIAESAGKDGTGILPVVGEPLGAPDQYGSDRLFVSLQLDGDTTHAAALDALEAAGHPVIRIRLQDAYDLGAQFFLWEMATAIAGHRMGIHPFNQPDVEAAKISARKMVAAYHETGALPSGETAEFSSETLTAFLSRAKPGDYISIHAYLHPTDEAAEALQAFRLALQKRTKLAVTVGYGPRFLHSTGQLHKGDAGNGLFIQFTASARQDAAIPDQAGQPESAMTFGVLKLAQALGDYEALVNANPPRRVIRFHLDEDIGETLKRI